MINLIDESANVIEEIPQGVCELLTRAISFQYMAYRDKLDNNEFLNKEKSLAEIYHEERKRCSSLIIKEGYDEQFICLIAKCREIENWDNDVELFEEHLTNESDNYIYYRLAINSLKLEEQKQYENSNLSSSDLIDKGVDSISLPKFMTIVNAITLLGHYMEVSKKHELFSSEIWQLEQNLRKYNFFELTRVKDLGYKKGQALIKLLYEGNPAYKVAMYSHLGFLTYLEKTRGLTKGKIHRIFQEMFFINGQRMAKEWQALDKDSEWNIKDKKNKRFKSLEFLPLAKKDYKELTNKK